MDSATIVEKPWSKGNKTETFDALRDVDDEVARNRRHLDLIEAYLDRVDRDLSYIHEDVY